MPPPRDLPCAACGQLMYRTRRSLPAGRAQCQPCRRSTGRVGYVRECIRCKAAFTTKQNRRRYCSILCANRDSNERRRIIQSGARFNRNRREAAAPGLTYRQRRALVSKWAKQGRTCTYCTAPGVTLDHVVPLIRGGTNWEGNLTPCCRSCNSSKAGQFITEWRSGRRCTAVEYVIPTARKARTNRPAVQLALDVLTCAHCSAPWVSVGTNKKKKFCSSRCQIQANALANRERYRERAGLPPTWERPVAHRTEWAS